MMAFSKIFLVCFAVAIAVQSATAHSAHAAVNAKAERQAVQDNVEGTMQTAQGTVEGVKQSAQAKVEQVVPLVAAAKSSAAAQLAVRNNRPQVRCSKCEARRRMQQQLRQQQLAQAQRPHGDTKA